MASVPRIIGEVPQPLDADLVTAVLFAGTLILALIHCVSLLSWAGLQCWLRRARPIFARQQND